MDGIVTSKKQATQTLRESKFTNVKHARKAVQRMPPGYKMDKARREGLFDCASRPRRR